MLGLYVRGQGMEERWDSMRTRSKSQQVFRAGIFLMVFVTSVCGALFAQQKAEVATLSQLVIPASYELSGVVLQSDGVTPLPEAAVQVRDVDKDKIVHEIKADKKGFYKVPHLSAGNYRVLFDQRVQVNLRVVRGKEPRMELFNVAMPQTKGAAPDEMPQAVSATEEGAAKK